MKRTGLALLLIMVGIGGVLLPSNLFSSDWFHLKSDLEYVDLNLSENENDWIFLHNTSVDIDLGKSMVNVQYLGEMEENADGSFCNRLQAGFGHRAGSGLSLMAAIVHFEESGMVPFTRNSWRAEIRHDYHRARHNLISRLSLEKDMTGKGHYSFLPVLSFTGFMDVIPEIGLFGELYQIDMQYTNAVLSRTTPQKPHLALEPVGTLKARLKGYYGEPLYITDISDDAEDNAKGDAKPDKYEQQISLDVTKKATQLVEIFASYDYTKTAYPFWGLDYESKIADFKAGAGIILRRTKNSALMGRMGFILREINSKVHYSDETDLENEASETTRLFAPEIIYMWSPDPLLQFNAKLYKEQDADDAAIDPLDQWRFFVSFSFCTL